MDCRTMEIYEADNKEALQDLMKNLESQEGRKLVALTNKQLKEAKPLDKTGRKNYMRNQPCPCGSTKKFKKCCWRQYA